MYSAMNDRKEIHYYQEIATAAVNLIRANISNPDQYEIYSIIGDIKAGLQTLIANNGGAGDLLKNFSKTVHRLLLDVTIIVENKSTKKFELIIFEVKKTPTLGLTQLSQLIGYCLVSKAKLGVLINVDKAVSGDFSLILDSDADLTKISRFIDGNTLTHELGVMIWNSDTQNIIYTNSGAIKSIPDLVRKVEVLLS